jgi:hypothetical protein
MEKPCHIFRASFSREQIHPKLANEPTTNARGGDFSARMLADLVRKGPTTVSLAEEVEAEDASPDERN